MVKKTINCITTLLLSFYLFLYFLCTEFPPPVIDNAKNFSGDELKKKQDNAALIVKTCYW